MENLSKNKDHSAETIPNEIVQTISSYTLDTLRKHSLTNKCVAFSAENTYTNVSGLQRSPGENILTHLKPEMKNDLLVGVGSPTDTLHNTIQHGCDQLSFDIDSMIMKIYNHFSIYTVRTEKLKEFCDSVDLHHKQLLKHCKTRWLSLFPAIERIFKLYPALKVYFLSLGRPPILLKNLF